MNLKDLKVVFAGCARNCSNFLPKVLDNIEFYSSFFSESYMIIVENGSTDKTKEILKNNQNKKNFFFV
jgi:glycosyltransferase involved in cell wall biosynthesis